MLWFFMFAGSFVASILAFDSWYERTYPEEHAYMKRRHDWQAIHGPYSNPPPLSAPKERPAHLKPPKDDNMADMLGIGDEE